MNILFIVCSIRIALYTLTLLLKKLSRFYYDMLLCFFAAIIRIVLLLKPSIGR